MRKKGFPFFVLFALLAALAVAGVSSSCWMYSRVRAYEKSHGVQVFADGSGTEENGSGSNACDRVDAPAEPRRLAVIGKARADADGREVVVKLTESPDPAVLKSYVTAGPLVEGDVSVSCDRCYDWDLDERVTCLTVRGAFAYGTNAWVRLAKGLPAKGEDAECKIEPLAEDVELTAPMGHRSTSLDFAASGRYLPPLGRRAIAVESVNMTNVSMSLRTVPPANVVPLLALDENAWNYVSASWWRSDDEWISDLSEPIAKFAAPIRNERDRDVTTALPLRLADGAVSNGIYLVSVEARGNGARRNRHRLVCVTDLAPNVRKTDNGLFVWVTSLAKGVPVAGAEVLAYTTANALVARGRTDANGWCECERVAKGEPFAVVVTAADGSDRSFIALRASAQMEESGLVSARENYLSRSACTAFAWTDRGIYRHGEPILFHALVRNGLGVAPASMPVVLSLVDSKNVTRRRVTLKTDPLGAVATSELSVPDDWPSGKWKLSLALPGADGSELVSRTVKIEEFAPPQVRVSVAPEGSANPSNFAFSVGAEHLFGGPARGLVCEGAVLFEDAAFAPEGWRGYAFGDDDRKLAKGFRRLRTTRLDESGRCRFEAPLFKDSGSPAAAIRVTCQATVIEDGGRPATARANAILHYYPLYLGARLGGVVRRPASGPVAIPLACVTPAGKRASGGLCLVAKVERIDTVSTYRTSKKGWGTWDCDRVRSTVAENLMFRSEPDRDTAIELPIDACGDYRVTVVEPVSGAGFSREFYLGDGEDCETRAALARPATVSLTADRPFYRPGDVPRLLVKSPFAGKALLSVFRDGLVHHETLALTNATCEIALPRAAYSWAPNVDVSLVVVQDVKSASNRFAVRAHGELALPVRRSEDEVEIRLGASVAIGEGGSEVTVDVDARGAGGPAERAVVTVVDEGINMLTGEPVPNPIARFAESRTATHDLFDLYGRLLPVVGEDALKANGAKTGGDTGAGLLGRVSLTPSRRFRPLALWRNDVALTGGCGRVTFRLPEFVGEVRVTAVAYGRRATGAAAVTRKVTPKLVMQPDAPRFVTPNDRFAFSMPLATRAGATGEVSWRVSVSGGARVDGACATEGRFAFAADAATNLLFEAVATGADGEAKIDYVAEGFGERHSRTILLPVRPSVAGRETAGVVALEPGARWRFEPVASKWPDAAQRVVSVGGSRLSELKAALAWLADYPHGCLEQTSSRILPLVTADGILNAIDPSSVPDRAAYVRAGVARVLSMFRGNGFVMWPDCNYAPWDPETSLYATHFLFEADRSSSADVKLSPDDRDRLLRFLRKQATDSTVAVSAYACHTLALAGSPETDRMLRLYDGRDKLDLLSRSRLARAFALTDDRQRAVALLANAESPASVIEASFLLLALCEIAPDDPRAPALVEWLECYRDATLCSWGTTGSNAHALMALGAYFRRHPPKEGRVEVAVLREDGTTAPIDARRTQFAGREEPTLVNVGEGTAYVSWRRIDRPADGDKAETSGPLTLTRRFRRADGSEVDFANVACGDLLVVELALTSSVARDYADLVIESPFAGACEPVLSEVSPVTYDWVGGSDHDWVMRSDARDDRMLVFSRKFHLDAGGSVVFRHPVRVVSPGDYALPGASVEAMYQPAIKSRLAIGRISVSADGGNRPRN